ncbi:large conductance mechanosensitive channel protein MscL [Microbacterium sp. KR10-403]|uniref:large conductance mechanosensitive channel protein MscL n=1 Tax=Microbacterium sp. KR10-403 TaxID=3158581 RepID=UPI0032E41020
MIKGFREFIAQGNVIDLAVAVVIGAAFSAIITALVNSIVNPIIALFFNAKSLDHVVWTVHGIYGQEVDFPLGGLVGAVINFLAIAIIVYFVFVYPMNRYKEHRAAKLAAGVEEPETLPSEQELLVQIRDLLEKQKS